MICRNIEAVVGSPQPFAAFPAEGRGGTCFHLQPATAVQAVNTRREAEAQQGGGRGDDGALICSLPHARTPVMSTACG